MKILKKLTALNSKFTGSFKKNCFHVSSRTRK